jgi:ATP adenylyltransferase
MDRLWAPWRLEYVAIAEKSDPNACLFCVKHAETDDAKNFVVARGKTVFSLLNIYPYNNGHLMIAPIRHVADIAELNDQERSEMMTLVVEMKKRLQKVLDPHGFNIGINCGAIAGAGIADHMHMHIVPRWSGDTNFMPVLADIRVIPQSLRALYELLIDEGDSR